MKKDKEAILEKLISGTEEVLGVGELKKKLALGRALIVKAGFDPTKPDLHLGHFVLIKKLREFQQFGNTVHFVIGDFTARIGDPSGRDSLRIPLSVEQIIENAKTYADQVFRVLDANKIKICFNSSWLMKLTLHEIVGIASQHTVSRMLEREDFSRRYTANKPIGIHEFLYPLLQSWDSVHLQADVELGGTDQKFNLLLGRELQRKAGQPPQVVMTLPILEGLDGHKKMSKSLGNYIRFNEPPREMFGKIMSISDALMWKYYRLVSTKSEEEISALVNATENGMNPKDAKIELALNITHMFHTLEAALDARNDFERRFSKHIAPEVVPVLEVKLPEEDILLVVLLKKARITSSTSEGIRMIKQNAVRIDGQKIQNTRLRIRRDNESLYQIGRRKFLRIRTI